MVPEMMTLFESLLGSPLPLILNIPYIFSCTTMVVFDIGGSVGFNILGRGIG